MEKTNTTEPSDNSQLDFTSSEFNALEALTTPNVEVPVPDAPVYDNLGQIISSIERSKAKQSGKDGDQPGPSRQKASVVPFKRQFLPHQEPVAGRGRGRPLRNLLTRMDEVTVGPMSVLRRCMAEKTRVKVWIRGAAWIRGFCTGYIAAFDKQWNLAMTDVDETFTRLRRRKTPVFGPVDHITDAMSSLKTSDEINEELTEPPGEETTFENETKEEFEGTEEPEDEYDEDAQYESPACPPKITTEWRPVVGRSTPPLERRPDPLTGLTIQQVQRRHEICQRHVQQLFIRGEQVAMVAVLPA